MPEVYETVNGVKITMGIDPDKSTYEVGETVTIWFRVDNLNKNYSATEVSINYNDGKTSNTLIAKTGGYGTSSSTSFTTTVHDNFKPCFDAVVEPIYSSPIITLQKIVWQGVTVWQDGKQTAIPVIPVKGGIKRILGLNWKNTGAYVFNVPQIYVYVSKSFGESCIVNYANHGLQNNSTSCGGEYMSSAVLPLDKVSVLTGYHDKDAEDWCYTPQSINTETILDKFIDSKTYSITLTKSFNCLAMFFRPGLGNTVEIYYNGNKIGSCTGTQPYGECYTHVIGNFKSGDIIKFKTTAPRLDIIRIKGLTFNLSKYSLHRVYLSNSSTPTQQPIEIKLKVFSVPEELANTLVNLLKSIGNPFKLTPSGTVYS